MQNPFVLVFLLGLTIGIGLGLYAGSPKFRRAINSLFSRGGGDGGDDDYSEE